MKLFQIEEPDGTPLSVEGPGAAVGIELGEDSAVAIAVGGNPELLARREGGEPAETLAALRQAAERVLARPVTHAVIAAAGLDHALRAVLTEAAAKAGLAALRLVPAAEAAEALADPARLDAAVLGAAILAEDLAPSA